MHVIPGTDHARERPETMITGIPGRPGRMAVAAATVLALVSAGSASAQNASAARTTRPAQGAATTVLAAGTAAGGRGQVPSPVVIGPVTGGIHGQPFTSSPVPLGLAGYTQQEIFLKGTATGDAQAGTWCSDGRWTGRAAETAAR